MGWNNVSNDKWHFEKRTLQSSLNIYRALLFPLRNLTGSVFINTESHTLYTWGSTADPDKLAWYAGWSTEKTGQGHAMLLMEYEF